MIVLTREITLKRSLELHNKYMLIFWSLENEQITVNTIELLPFDI